MKKLILAFLAIGSIGTANAQKGSILMYGTAGVNYTDNDNGVVSGYDKTTQWNISPGIGYQLGNHITLGVQGGYMNKLVETRGLNAAATPVFVENNIKDREWTAGAFFRYTQHLTGIFNMFTQIEGGYISGKNVTETITYNTTGSIITKPTDTYTGFQGMITPAIAIMVHEGFALNFSFGGIGYRTVSYEIAPTVKSSFNFTMGNQFNIGVSRNIGGCCGHRHRHGHSDPNAEMHKMKKMHDDEDDE